MTWLNDPAHARWLEAETDRLLEFGRASVHPDGGFGWLDDERPPDRRPAGRALDHLPDDPRLRPRTPARPAGLRRRWSTTACAALQRPVPRPRARRLVRRGGRGRADRHRQDGLRARVRASSPPPAPPRPAPRAAASCWTRRSPCWTEHFWDDDAGMVVEQWDAAWTTLDGYRGVNANMHTVEAFLAAADVDRRPVAGATGRCGSPTGSCTASAPATTGGIPEHFDATWTPLLDYNRDSRRTRSGPTAPPSGTGWSGPGWRSPARRPRRRRAAGLAARRRARPVRRGRARGLGRRRRRRLRLHGRLGRRTRRARADALGGRRGAAAAAALHAVDRRGRLRRVVPDLVGPHRGLVLDRDGGSWWHELGRNRPRGTWAGKPDPYHAFQATLIPRLPVAPRSPRPWPGACWTGEAAARQPAHAAPAAVTPRVTDGHGWSRPAPGRPAQAA